MIEQLEQDIGGLLEQAEVTDISYANGAKVGALERESIEVLVATGRGKVRQYDFRPPQAPKDPPANSQPWIKRMK